jgi:hypothetical protein
MPYGRGGLHEAGKSGENTFGLTRMLEPVAITLSVRIVAHHFGQAQRAEHVADSLDAPAHCARDLAWRELAIFREQLYDGECYRISEQPAQPRLSVALLLHATYVSCFRNSENVEAFTC